MDKLVFITSRFPYPASKGDQLRVLFQLKHLSKIYSISLISLSTNTPTEEELQEITRHGIDVYNFRVPKAQRYFNTFAALFSTTPFQVAYFYSSRIGKKIARVIENIRPDIIHCHLIRTAKYAKGFAVDKSSLDYMDAYGLGMKKRQDFAKSFISKLAYTVEKNRLFKFEADVFDRFKFHQAISNQDAQAIEHPEKGSIHISPNGVDFDQFFPKENDSIKPYDLVFMGNMDYPPNIVAATFVAEKVLPVIRESIPSIRFLIAGRNAGKQIKSLESAHVKVEEHFDDISDAISSAKIMLAPMHMSIGLQNKIIQSMAMKIPCIASESANQAIGATNDQHILIADSPEEFARAISKLLSDKELYSTISENGYQFVHDHFDWADQIQNLADSWKN